MSLAESQVYNATRQKKHIDKRFQQQYAMKSKIAGIFVI